MRNITGFTTAEIFDLCGLVRRETADARENVWPPILGLFKAVVVTLTYLRRNRVQAELAETFGVSQPTISRAISGLTPVLDRVLSDYVPVAEDLDPRTGYIVDGTLLPCWSWHGQQQLYSGKHHTTGMNVQVVCDLSGRLAWISDPVDGCRHDTAALRTSGALDTGRAWRGLNVDMGDSDWLVSAAERGNPATRLDRRHDDGRPWTVGNEVRVLSHGASYFPELLRCVRLMRDGDLLLFTDWRGDPDQTLGEEGSEVSAVLCAAAARGVVVKGLIWRSHLDRFGFSEQQNRDLGEEIGAAGGECLRDMRVRPGGSHHQKFIVLRHPGRRDLDVAFAGGIDLCHSRFDGAEHHGDRQRQPMAAVYGPRPPWHDVQLAVRGPAVGDIETVFRERWEDPAPLSQNPVYRIADALRREDTTPGVLPAQLPDPLPRGRQTVQVLRTYPKRRERYPFAPDGERSIAHAYAKAVARAHSLIYLEDQYLWSAEVVACFAAALRATPELRLIAVVPHHPDQDGRLSLPPNLVGRQQALDLLRRAGGDRVGVYGIENAAGTPVYVHAKVCVIDDVWASVGSDNINRRSWTHDSELSCAVLDEAPDPRHPRVVDRFGAGARVFARELRLSLAREHLDRRPGDEEDLLDPQTAFAAFAASARTLARWHGDGQRGPRPPGRLRPYDAPRLNRRTLTWATPLYRRVYDPDGRPAALRRRHRF